METKREILSFDMDLFLERIETLINDKCEGNKANFNEIIGQRDAEYRWRNFRRFPKIEILIKICNHFGVSLPWLLGMDEDTDLEESNEMLNVAQLRELLYHYKDMLDHYRQINRSLRQLVPDQSMDPCKGMVEQA